MELLHPKEIFANTTGNNHDTESIQGEYTIYDYVYDFCCHFWPTKSNPFSQEAVVH